MGTLICFELRKIWGNRAGMVACALVPALLTALSVLNLTTTSTRDVATGRMALGIEGQHAYRRMVESHAGTLTNERVAADAATLDHANELADQTPGLYDLSNDEIIQTYGLEFWQQTMAVVSQQYYLEVVGTLDSATPRATSLQEGAKARINGALGIGLLGQFPYGDAERAYWRTKAAQVRWPVEYGYTGGWDNAMDYASFLGLAIVALCIALSGTFAGEYQSRTAAIVLPTQRGKRALPLAKVVAAFIFVTAYWWLCSLVVVGINLGICGADGGNLPLQVALGFDNPYPLTVWQATALLYALGYLIALGMAAFTLALSSRLRSTMPVAVVPMAVVFLGMFALLITPLAKIGALTPMGGLDCAIAQMVSYAAGPAVADLPTVLALIYGVLLVALTPLATRSFARHQVA